MAIQQYTRGDWPIRRWPNISFNEAACSETGLCFIDPDFLDVIQSGRSYLEIPFDFTSIYRDEQHSIEVAKVAAGRKPGSHSMGVAVDIRARGGRAIKIIKWATDAIASNIASNISLTGIGIKQKNGWFIHIDAMSRNQCASLGMDASGTGWRNRLWTY